MNGTADIFKCPGGWCPLRYTYSCSECGAQYSVFVTFEKPER